MVKSTSNLDNVTLTCTTEPLCVPCQHCRNVAHKSNACPKVPVCHPAILKVIVLTIYAHCYRIL